MTIEPAHAVVSCMFARPDEFAAALARSRDGEGVERVQNCVRTGLLSAELVSPYASDRWQGTDIRLYQDEMLRELPAATTELVQAVGRAATIQFPEWAPNYAMTKTTTEGFGLHPDRTDFRHFSVFVALLGRTDFYYQTLGGKLRGLILNPGDTLVMRQSAHLLDEGSRIVHGVGKSGLRAWLNISCVDTLPPRPNSMAASRPSTEFMDSLH